MAGVDGGSPQSPLVRKLYASAAELGLTREERLDLAEYLLRRDVQSWKDLTDEQVLRMLDAFDGFNLIVELLSQRSPSQDTIGGR